jgi:hypothetical protein
VRGVVEREEDGKLRSWRGGHAGWLSGGAVERKAPWRVRSPRWCRRAAKHGPSLPLACSRSLPRTGARALCSLSLSHAAGLAHAHALLDRRNSKRRRVA